MCVCIYIYILSIQRLLGLYLNSLVWLYIIYIYIHISSSSSYVENRKFPDSLSLSFSLTPSVFTIRLLLAGLINSRAGVSPCSSVKNGLFHMLCSIRECCSWICPYFFSSVLPVFLHVTWIVCEMGRKWAYSCCFVGCCFQGFFKAAHSFLE